MPATEADMPIPDHLIDNLLECLAQLDRIGAQTAAAHLDAAIHALISDQARQLTSKTA